MAAYSTTPPSWPGQDSAYAAYYSSQYPGYPYNYDPYYQQYYAQEPAPGAAPPTEGYPAADAAKADAPGAPAPPPADAAAAPPSGAAPPSTDPAGAQQQQHYDYQQYYDYYNSGAYQGYPGYGGYPPPYPSYPGYPGYSSAPQPAQGPPGPRLPPGNPSAQQQQQQLGAESGGGATVAATVPGPRPPPGNPPPSSNNAASSAAAAAYHAVPPPTANKPGAIRPQVPPAILANAKAIGASAVARITGHAPAASSVAAHYQQAPSYTAVHSSSTATTSTKPPLKSPSSSASGAGSKFPPTFTAWVERCFERCRTDTDRQAMTVQLTARIKSVESAGRMWAVDWDTEPIPVITTSASSAIDLTLSPTSSRNGEGGLRNKRSRWEESETAASAAQLHLQQQQQRPLSKKQQKLLQQQLYQQQLQLQQQQGNKKQRKQQQQNGKAAAAAQALAESNNRRMARSGRFGSGDARYKPSSSAMYGDSDDSGSDMDLGFDVESVVIQGTCTHLEKSYFRLTGPPEPSEVRPPHVLRKALDRLVGLLRQGTVNNFYACDQFKGMRQDCTVQHLRDELAVAVYEAHARESLEYGDLAEFNQCQTQLASLYADRVPGCVAEFAAYKLLYNLVHARAGANKALLHTLRSVLALQQQLRAAAPAGSSTGSSNSSSTTTGPTDPQGAVANALRARTAAFAADYPAFFRAYAEAPALGRALLDSYIPQLRWTALNMIVKTYKPSVPVSFVARMLGFILPPGCAAPAAPAGSEGLPGMRQPVYTGKAVAAEDEEQGTAACIAWLQAHGAVVQDADSPDAVLDAKASMGQLSVPEEPKVAHGDENLSVGDFLARASALLTA